MRARGIRTTGKEGFRARAAAAQANGFEALPLFAAAVIVGLWQGGDAEWIDRLAGLFIGARLIFIFCYWTRPCDAPLARLGRRLPVQHRDLHQPGLELRRNCCSVPTLICLILICHWLIMLDRWRGTHEDI